MIFFSYSRDDSEFVLNLAKEMRAEGADVWLDQLDIKPGSRWDKSIEDALDASDAVLVILSKTSVDSNNVMDEVSYALEEEKTVIPVLFEECDVPFRIRRLQFADFTESHEKGMATLTKALELEGEAQPAASEAEPTEKAVNEPVQVVNEPSKTVEKITARGDRDEPAQATPKKSKSRLILYIIIGIAVIVGALAIGGVFTKNTNPVDAREKLELKKKEDLNNIRTVEKPDYSALQDELTAIAKGIRFNADSDKLDTNSREFTTLLKMLKKYPDAKINIECHVHDQGSRIRNAALSKNQAIVISKILQEKGISANRINSVGMGESKPIASNNTREGRAANTRVEMTFSQ